jgi:hypothetical protein
MRRLRLPFSSSETWSCPAVFGLPLLWPGTGSADTLMSSIA